MRLEPLFRILFVVYCVEAGLFLLLSPWSPTWDRLAAALPWALLRYGALALPARGAVSGFGFVHILWALHDVDQMLRRLPRSDSPGGRPR